MIDPAWQAPVDLGNCAAEPIHVPGAIQPHGVLIAVTEPDLTIAVASENLPFWFATPATRAVGRPLADVAGPVLAGAVAEAAASGWPERYDGLQVPGPAGPLDAALHRSGPYLVIELERARPGTATTRTQRDVAMNLNGARTVEGVADVAADAVRSLTGFDRVMCYRFDEEWNGEVIAEARREDLNTFLGLHYPASDIPAQARELYRRNWIRLIADIAYRPVPLHPAVAHDSARPLDLSLSTLRSVSPMHVEYLTNMGVDASMSLSLIIGGELWGLIACHHYDGTHHVPVPVRHAAEHVAQLTSVRLREVMERQDREHTLELSAIAAGLFDEFATTDDDLETVLRRHDGKVLALARATGALVVEGRRVLALGAVAPPAVVDAVLGAWPERTEVFETANLASVAPGLDTGGVGGLLAVALTSDKHSYAMWFRPELVHRVDWGGDPRNAEIALQEGDGVRLSPRRSFEKWREVVRGRSEPWHPTEVASALRFARATGARLLRRDRSAVALSANLQRALLPATLPTLDGITVDAYSAPDGAGRVGGDWYDAFPLGGARLALAVGDIAGHGVEAAAVMAQARNCLRAYLLDHASPAAALDRMNRFFTELLANEIATVVVAVVDRRTRRARVASAGHPPPLVVRGGTATYVERARGTVLGLRGVSYDEVEVDLRTDTTLVLYTDGLVESRARSLDEGFELLLAQASRLTAADVTGTARELTDAMTDADRSDDVTVLVSRFSAPGG